MEVGIWLLYRVSIGGQGNFGLVGDILFISGVFSWSGISHS